MSDSEEDYMSDAFLAKCEEKRPGLASAHVAKKHKTEAKIKTLNLQNRIKPRKVLEAENRSEGLNQAIGEGNKGFAILQKMGYKPGMVMGKKGTGRAEPVPIHFRSGRGGLGEAAEKKRKAEEMSAMRALMMRKRKKQEAFAQEDFRALHSKQMAEKRAEKDLYMSQRVCEQLDEEQGIENPEETFFWTMAKMNLILEMKNKKDSEHDEDSNSETDNELDESEQDEVVDLSSGLTVSLWVSYNKRWWTYHQVLQLLNNYRPSHNICGTLTNIVSGVVPALMILRTLSKIVQGLHRTLTIADHCTMG